MGKRVHTPLCAFLDPDHEGKCYAAGEIVETANHAYRQAASEADRDAEITDLRHTVAAHTATALAQVIAAQRAVRRLMSDQVYDVEYAESEGRAVAGLLARVEDDLTATRALAERIENG